MNHIRRVYFAGEGPPWPIHRLMVVLKGSKPAKGAPAWGESERRAFGDANRSDKALSPDPSCYEHEGAE